MSSSVSLDYCSLLQTFFWVSWSWGTCEGISNLGLCRYCYFMHCPLVQEICIAHLYRKMRYLQKSICLSVDILCMHLDFSQFVALQKYWEWNSVLVGKVFSSLDFKMTWVSFPGCAFLFPSSPITIMGSVYSVFKLHFL